MKVHMKVHKKAAAFVCAAFLTAGLSLTVNADTVDLGYGQTVNTSPGVHAKALLGIPSQESMRTKEQNKFFNDLNTTYRDAVNQSLAAEYSVPVPKFTGNVLDGMQVYQLSGDSSLGHHTAWYITYDYPKSMIDQLIATEKTILETGTDADKAKIKYPVSHVASEYAKSTAQEAIRNLKAKKISEKELQPKLAEINGQIAEPILKGVELSMKDDKTRSEQDKRDTYEIIKFMLEQTKLGATSVSYEPVRTTYGASAKGAVRGSLEYDGFRLPLAVIGYVTPADEGLATQILITEDTGYDFWNRELSLMNGHQGTKGGK